MEVLDGLGLDTPICAQDVMYALQTTGMWDAIEEEMLGRRDQRRTQLLEKEKVKETERKGYFEEDDEINGEQLEDQLGCMEKEKEEKKGPPEEEEEESCDAESSVQKRDEAAREVLRPQRHRQKPAALRDVEILSEAGSEGTVWTLHYAKRRKSAPMSIPLTVKENRVRGWVKLEMGAKVEDRWRLEGLEVRHSPTHGGVGGRGVFVKPGYYLEPKVSIPYFGKKIDLEDIDGEETSYMVGPLAEGGFLDGNPAVVANARYGADAELWAGALVNQANTPAERNCLLGDVRSSARVPARAHYLEHCPEGLYVKVETTRIVHAGEELLTNYGLDFAGQWATRCGYDYHAETVLGEPRGEAERPDPEADTDTLVRRRGRK
jgi:hypothetical protein